MPQLVWDNMSDRLFETGLDRGVLYTSDTYGIAWNGLTSVDVSDDGNSSSPIYFDGVKVFDVVNPGDVTATIKAVTYPDEFASFDGYAELEPGLRLGNQPRQTFGLSYRTLIGDPLVGDSLGYKLHVLFNLTAVPDGVTYQTQSSNVEVVEFSWSATSTPINVIGWRPTGHLVVDSTRTDDDLLDIIERVLYGADDEYPRIFTAAELLGMNHYGYVPASPY